MSKIDPFDLGYVWDTNAPSGQAWQCPDCPSWATFGGNAGFHAKTMDHGLPTLVPIPDVGERGVQPGFTKHNEREAAMAEVLGDINQAEGAFMIDEIDKGMHLLAQAKHKLEELLGEV